MGDAMTYGILDQWLEYEARDYCRPGLVLNLEFDAQPFLVACAFDIQIELHHL